MPSTRECDFCGDDIEPGTGTMFVAVNGEVTHFCSAKCEKNADLGREPRDHEWTAAGQRVTPEAHGLASEAEPADEPTTTEETSEGTDRPTDDTPPDEEPAEADAAPATDADSPTPNLQRVEETTAELDDSDTDEPTGDEADEPEDAESTSPDEAATDEDTS